MQAQQSAVEKQLSEARARIAEGSTAKEAEGDRLRKELEDATAAAAQVGDRDWVGTIQTLSPYVVAAC